MTATKQSFTSSSQGTSKARRNAASNAGLIEIQIQYRAVGDLVLDPRNPRQHSQRQVNQIADSIREFGFVMPIVVDDTGQVVIGHGRVLAARKLGMPRVPVVEIKHLSQAQLKALRIADNRLAQHAHWDERLLGESFLELKELDLDFDLGVTGFSLPEIDLVIQKKHEEGVTVEPSDDADAVSGVPVCRPGDTWQLGDHRLHCGDATSEAAFENLMPEGRAHVVFIDPPYNVPIDGHASGKGKIRHREFAQGSGELSKEAFTRFLTLGCTLLAKYSESGAIHFVCMDWRHADELLAAGGGVYSELKNIVVWVKSNAGMGSLYRSQHELVFVFKSGAGRHTNNIELGKHGRNRTNVWHYDGASTQARKGNNMLELHPTTKPVQLVMDALLDCSNRSETVLDSFLGSGTTLLAAERTGRKCRGIELDPLYVDTAIRRWQNLTGRDAIRISDGKAFREIEAEIGQNDEQISEQAL
ncbi:DNA methyltransferase [Bradyrhizobium sp. th.b2]|uniref:site-specific DNA-methyltransferase n=1 Tax=Bradyrhizobium sp. th-b2 TaxID=172088 RepID=UPI001FD8E1B7|nr:DNA methyltransferase [Bradyrhizobium sp. th.b2]